jgi:hypothetical protein
VSWCARGIPPPPVAGITLQNTSTYTPCGLQETKDTKVLRRAYGQVNDTRVQGTLARDPVTTTSQRDPVACKHSRLLELASELTGRCYAKGRLRDARRI